MFNLHELSDWDLILVCWFPHSGGRWLNRGLFGRHDGVILTEYFTPWLNHSVDAILGLDKTSQVHKSRSLPPLRAEFDMVVRSVEAARRAGLAQYFSDKRQQAAREAPGCRAMGALPVGSHVGAPDFALLVDLLPRLRLVQLVRDPVECFASLRSRRELDGDPYLAAADWMRLNAALRQFRENDRDRRHALIRYEDLTADADTALRRLCADLDLPFMAAMLDGIGEYHGRNRDASPMEAVTVAEAKIIRRLSGVEATHYGYQSDGGEKG